MVILVTRLILNLRSVYLPATSRSADGSVRFTTNSTHVVGNIGAPLSFEDTRYPDLLDGINHNLHADFGDAQGGIVIASDPMSVGILATSAGGSQQHPTV